MKVQTFALYFGNRGLFPEALIASAREEIATAVERAGFAYLMPPADMTRCGAVETKDEGLTYAAWLKSHEGEYDGIIMSLPNFSDKHGAVAAVANATKPIIIQAYPDEVGKAGLELRRDAYSHPAGRDIPRYDTAGTDDSAFADGHTGNNGNIAGNPYIILDMDGRCELRYDPSSVLQVRYPL